MRQTTTEYYQQLLQAASEKGYCDDYVDALLDIAALDDAKLRRLYSICDRSRQSDLFGVLRALSCGVISYTQLWQILEKRLAVPVVLQWLDTFDSRDYTTPRRTILCEVAEKTGETISTLRASGFAEELILTKG